MLCLHFSSCYAEGEIMKGDFSEASEDWQFNYKREIGCGWTGMHADDWNFFLNGFTFEP